MTLNTLGDLARSFQMRTQQVRMKTEIDQLSLEVSSGRTADVAKRVGGDFVPLAKLNRDIVSLQAYRTSTAEAAGFVGTSQLALGVISESLSRLGPEVLSAPAKGAVDLGSTYGVQSVAAFEGAVAQLNSGFAGRYLFAGAATDTKPVSDAEVMLADLQAAVSGETTAAGIASVVDTWFGAGGTYETAHYFGSGSGLTPLRIGDNETLSVGSSALDDRLRSALKGLALGALLERGPLDGNPGEQDELARLAGETMISASDQVIDLRAETGSAENALQRAEVRIGAEMSALELTRNELLAVDPYEAASRLENTQSQLEVLYSVTARVSQLSLADFLR